MPCLAPKAIRAFYVDFTLHQLRLLRPDYSIRFRCLGASCPDTCCAHWQVLLDPETLSKYQALEPGPLKLLIEDSLQPPAPGTAPPECKAFRLQPDGKCPLLGTEGLCRIQMELGAGALGTVCATYPRKSTTIDHLEETSLALSCPEAARLVLLDPNLLKGSPQGFYRMNWDEASTSLDPPRAFFWPIRTFLIHLLRDRRYELWQRLFLVGLFCRRLDAVACSEPRQPVAGFLREFSAAVESGALAPAMERIPADPALQLDLLLTLIHLRLADTRPGARLSQTLKEFTSGIGLQNRSMAAQLVPAYNHAARCWLEPFLLRNPHFLENLLINAVFHDLFPFGSSLGQPAVPLEAERSFVRLAMRFALIRGLLIGVAGHYRQALDSRHALRTVQTASKYFEHRPSFIEQAENLLADRSANSVHGLAMLIRGFPAQTPQTQSGTAPDRTAPQCSTAIRA